jgi:thiamine pyrophosphokinase
MQLPQAFHQHQEWTLVGPMGPQAPTKLLEHPVLAVDGGSQFSDKIDLWLGDGDSSAENVHCRYKYQFSPHKSHSDLALAFDLLSCLERCTLHCWGFLGGRRDHELLNLGEALRFLNSHPNSRLYFYDETGRIAVECLAAGEWSIFREGLFSLASIKDVVLKMTGECSFPIPQEITLEPMSSLGLSNSGHGHIHLLTQGAVMLIYGDKR